MKKVISTLKNLVHTLPARQTYTPTYRVVNLEQDTLGDYVATIQMIGKNITFAAKPEELLADDKMTEQFSPKDVRTLTYLGYLGINSPKYKILAQRLSQDNDQTLFALLKKGATQVEHKTATEISSNKEILKSLNQEDAHKIGHIAAMESVMDEKRQKAVALEQAKLENTLQK